MHLGGGQQRLADAPLPVVDADQGFDFEGFDEDGVHGGRAGIGDWGLGIGDSVKATATATATATAKQRQRQRQELNAPTVIALANHQYRIPNPEPPTQEASQPRPPADSRTR